MRFFVVSDIHSFYEPLIKALDGAGFDASNPDHWLVVCGDCFDRGPDSGLVLQFLMTLERKILIKGNHDSFLKDNTFNKSLFQWIKDYYLLKEVTEAAMIDAIDLVYYRQTGDLKIIKEKYFIIYGG